MANLGHVIFFSLIGGIFSLIGGLLLISNKKKAYSLASYATPFAAGALLAAAFLDLLVEANKEGDIEKALYGVLGGILIFFLLERFLRWFHHHHEHEEIDKKELSKSNIPLIIAGDTVHNAIDGIAIAAAFIVSIPVGITTTLAVAAHEIPQEIGDFGLLIKKGMRRKSVVLVNIISAVATTVSAVVFFKLGQQIALPLDIILGLVAGFFLYIALSDIVPSIHEVTDKTKANYLTLSLLMGVLFVGLSTNLLHKYIEPETTEHTSQE